MTYRRSQDVNTLAGFAMVIALCLSALTGHSIAHAQVPSIFDVSDNRSIYPNNTIPRYELFEITLNIATAATNLYWPYQSATPPGIPSGAGVTVDVTLTHDNWATTHRIPAFFYEGFLDQTKGGNAWYYPAGTAQWKARFSPHATGNWQYKIRVEDKNGSTESSAQAFTVTTSNDKGFIKVSKKDRRYFEYDDGSYFPGLGYNLNYRRIDWINPNSNIPTFQAMQENDINLTRTWISQWSIFGSTWGMWLSQNPAHQTQEPHMGIVHQGDAQLDAYANITPPAAINDVYLWLSADETVFAGGKQYRLTPCRVFGWETAKIPLKQNAVYRIRARYNAQGLEGPRVAGSPMGFAIKEGGWLWSNNETGRCYYPGTGTVLAATYNTTGNEPWTNYPDSQHPGWRILEGTFNSGSKDFLNYLYLAIENTVSTDGDNASGHVFVDEVSIQENLGSGAFGPNVIYKGSMAHHTYINQRNAYAFDKVLDLAHQYGIYLKPVMNEKNDYVFQIFNFDGTMPSTKDGNLFYGNGTESAGASKVRWLQESWWRYMQARWGYSQNIHSWELLNEGPPETRHFILADEFAKYMKCEVFGIPAGGDCTYAHPNQHMVTTSFWSGFPWNFWRNTSGSYPDLDYADIHDYMDTSTETGYYDAALFTLTASKKFGANEPGGALKPVIRGETGWIFSGTDLFAANASNGLWLHNLIWGGINASGLIEHYWVGSPTQDHIYKAGSHDHRPMFKAYSNFIKDIPLNNGNYVDAAAMARVTALRAWGQKDTVNGRAHLWMQNSAHTWKNIYDGVAISPITTTVTIPGFAPNMNYAVEWWNTSAGYPTNNETRTSDNGGNLVLQVTNLATDIAVRISAYTTPQPPTNLRLVTN